jgi:hypothetical protein
LNPRYEELHPRLRRVELIHAGVPRVGGNDTDALASIGQQPNIKIRRTSTSTHSLILDETRPTIEPVDVLASTLPA